VVCRDAVDRDAAERALSRLGSLEADGRLWEKSVLTDVMKSLYAASAEEGDCRIQVMTLHKAKGLEFGTAILPALDRQPRADTTQLLNWFESTLDGRAQLLLAPLEQSGVPQGRRDRINRLVRKARERCDEQEKLRLLYVACTRARHHLHLIARIHRNAQGHYQTPINSSLLKPLWPLLESELATTDTHKSTSQPKDPIPPVSDTHVQLALQIDPAPTVGQSPLLERLPIDVEMPSFSVFEWEKVVKKQEIDTDSVTFSWAGRTARDIGTVVHQQLQMLAQRTDGLAEVDFAAVATVVERQLRNMGVQKEILPQATDTVLQAVRGTLADERGRWALSPHAEARSEWALSVVEGTGEGSAAPGENMGVWNREVRQVVIDRTFVDAQGVRWIVDFKTGDHQGGQVELFLDSEQKRYADQLNRYADIIRRMDGRPIRVGLYFPLLKGWREWEPPVSQLDSAD
jgi:ATP-dependent exoDNAse (exonuclease V) beta subunit